VSEPTEQLALLEPGRRVRIEGREVEIQSRKGTAARPVVKVDSVDDREAARALGGAAIEVPRGELLLAEGDYLVADLIGCAVCGGGAQIGTVRDVLVLPTVEALEVERERGPELLVPMVEDAVRRIDLEQRVIEIEPSFVEPAEHER
jgi:16S rRNA processing protein RimM